MTVQTFNCHASWMLCAVNGHRISRRLQKSRRKFRRRQQGWPKVQISFNARNNLVSILERRQMRGMWKRIMKSWVVCGGWFCSALWSWFCSYTASSDIKDVWNKANRRQDQNKQKKVVLHMRSRGTEELFAIECCGCSKFTLAQGVPGLVHLIEIFEDA